LTTGYRNGIYNVSTELSGGVMQVLNYRDSLSKERNFLLDDVGEADSFDPKCVVIIGHARNELKDKEKRKSFELFRRQLSDVEVITYDELFDRTKRLVQTLEGVANDDD
jgi:DNA polymerase III delta subunit